MIGAQLKVWAIVTVGVLAISIPISAQHYQKHEGILLTAVDPEGPAAAAGIERGDLILKIEGQNISRPEDIVKLLANAKTADVTLTIKHGDDLRDQVVQIDRVWGKPRIGVMIAIGSGFDPNFMKPDYQSKRKHGFEQRRKLMGRVPMDQLRNRLPRMPGIIVREVISGGPADIAGLQRGDLLTIVGGIALNGPADQLVDIMSLSKPGEEIKIYYERDEQKMSAVVILGMDAETGLAKLGIGYRAPTPTAVDGYMKKFSGDHRGQYQLPPKKRGNKANYQLQPDFWNYQGKAGYPL